MSSHKNLIFGFGDIHIFSGVFYKLERDNLLNQIETFITSSGSALIVLLYLVGYTPLDIIFIIFEHNLSMYFKSYNLTIMKHFGLVCLEDLRKTVANLVTTKLGMIPTLKGLYLLSGKNFQISAYDISANEHYFLSHELNPSMLCVDAILQTTEYFYFRGDKIMINGSLYYPCPPNITDDSNDSENSSIIVYTISEPDLSLLHTAEKIVVNTAIYNEIPIKKALYDINKSSNNMYICISSGFNFCDIDDLDYMIMQVTRGFTCDTSFGTDSPTSDWELVKSPASNECLEEVFIAGDMYYVETTTTTTSQTTPTTQ